MTNVICVSAEVASNLRFRGLGNANLDPIRLDDGRYAIAEAALVDRAFAQYRPLLAAASLEDASTLTFIGGDDIYLTVDSKEVYTTCARTSHAFGIPETDTFRFEVRQNETGYPPDLVQSTWRRRSELVSKTPAYYSSDTLWASFSMVIADGATFDVGYGDYTTLYQWHHPTDIGDGPVMTIEVNNGNLEVVTRSDDDNPDRDRVVHYSETRHEDGVVADFVISGLLGSGGHLNVWLDGSQIVDDDCGIGYYTEGGSGLAVPHWGIYQDNVSDPAVVFFANMEWGTADLSARVSTPLSVVVPAGGWV